MNDPTKANSISIVVDDCPIEVPTGANLLDACLENNIYIPNLCHIKDADHPSASCRICFVEIDSEPQPVTACTVSVTAPMKVTTDTEDVRRLQRAALNLLLSVHKVTCKTCPANRQCALQNIARFLKVGLKAKKVPLRLKPQDCIETHPTIDYWPNRCVLCGHCIHACQNAHGQPLMTFAGRGFDTTISFYVSHNSPAGDTSCADCAACIAVCPVSALTLRR